MRSKLSSYFKDNLVAFLALFVALGGTSAYAANTVFSTDIVDGQVKSVDIGNGEVNSADVKDQSLTTFDVSTFLGADIVDGSLTSADVAPGTFVEGRGQLLSNRMVFTPGGGPLDQRLLLLIPGLGRLTAQCGSNGAFIRYLNDSGGPVDIWDDHLNAGQVDGRVLPNNTAFTIVSSTRTFTPDVEGTTVGIGVGDTGSRRVATLHVFAFQEVDNNPCGFQAQGTLWTSP